jgi:hypothetical protein
MVMTKEILFPLDRGLNHKSRKKSANATGVSVRNAPRVETVQEVKPTIAPDVEIMNAVMSATGARLKAECPRRNVVSGSNVPNTSE